MQQLFELVRILLGKGGLGAVRAAGSSFQSFQPVGIDAYSGGRGSSASSVLLKQYPISQQIQLCPSVHQSFDCFQAVDLPFQLCIAPGIG